MSGESDVQDALRKIFEPTRDLRPAAFSGASASAPGRRSCTSTWPTPGRGLATRSRATAWTRSPRRAEANEAGRAKGIPIVYTTTG